MEKSTEKKLEALGLHIADGSYFVTDSFAVQMSGANVDLTFPEQVYAGLPRPYSDVVALLQDKDPKVQDFMLMAALCSIGAALYRAEMIGLNYGIEHPMFYFCLVAPPASGKGMMDNCKAFVRGLDKLRREERNEQRQFRSFLFRGDTSTAAIYQRLRDSDERGMIFATEADAVGKAMATDYGAQFSTLLRCAYSGEESGADRKDEEIGIEHPYLGVLLSGTEDQLPTLFGKEMMSGLFSRFAFYTFNPKRKAESCLHRPDQLSYPAAFKQLGDEFHDRLMSLYKANSIKVMYTDEVDDMLTKAMQAEIDAVKDGDGEDAAGLAFRSGVLMRRLTMNFALVRYMYEYDPAPGEDVVIEPSADDCRRAIAIAQVLFNHMMVFYRKAHPRASKTEAVKALLLDRSKKWTPTEIARETNSTRQYVYKVMNELGLRSVAK